MGRKRVSQHRRGVRRLVTRYFFGAFSFLSGNGAYSFSFDAASQTLAVSDLLEVPYPADPAKKNGATMLIFPGGNLRRLSTMVDRTVMDLPGYGYAKAPKNEIGRWTALIRDYLRGRTPLKRVILLIDGRHGLKPDDKAVMDALDTAAVTYQLVLTKADKVKPTEIAALAKATSAAISKRPAAHPEIIATSSETGLGIELLRAEIAALA